MLVVPIASTFLHVGDDNPMGYQIHYDGSHGIDQLAEAAGRVCYQSFGRPNPKTATNQGYLQNILDQGHFSVLEHGSVSFYVEGVSRALMLELERHRFLSFSVISQRYVDHSDARFLVPPEVVKYGREQLEAEGIEIPSDFEQVTEQSFEQVYLPDARESYKELYQELTDAGRPRKVARGAARAVLPECTEVKMIVTGNIRCWRDVIMKRYHAAADAEIREFSQQVLEQLRDFAPNALQDIPNEPYG